MSKKLNLIIGESNTIREHVTINTGTIQGGGITKVGNNNLIMIGAHIAHDCILEIILLWLIILRLLVML